jgi:SAM-dependent methyltransferase
LPAMREQIKSCHACGAAEFDEICPTSFLRRDERHILVCQKCGLGFLWPQPTPEELTEYYSGGYFGFDKAKEEGKGRYWASRLEKISPHGHFLDVGCATGFMIHGIQQNSGWNVSGVEYSTQASSYARDTLGLDVKTGPLGTAEWDSDFFDYIHMNNVIEHETSPLGLLKEGARILKPGGELFLAMPNGRVDREPYKVYFEKKNEKAGSQDGHLYFFSPESLLDLCGKAGLKVRRVYTAGMIRGAKTLGLLPRNRAFYLGHAPRDQRPSEQSIEDSIKPGKKYPSWYYRFKHGKERLNRWPGFWNFGYDFHLHLTK